MSCQGDPIECGYEAALGQAEERIRQMEAGAPHPQVGPQWDLTKEEAGRFLDAVTSDTLPPGWRLRPEASWLGKDGPLCTIAAHDPAEPADDRGRRPSDVLVGIVLTGLAEPLCAAYNDQADAKGMS